MKKFLLYVIIMLSVLTTFSQDGQRLEPLKIAYITRKLDLSPQEAQVFWPVYNQYSAEMRNARMDANRNGRSELELEETLLGIRKKYDGEFGKVLSRDKVNLFYRSEKEFGNFVQKEIERRQLRMQERHSNNRP
jgi:hypothetical protein